VLAAGFGRPADGDHFDERAHGVWDKHGDLGHPGHTVGHGASLVEHNALHLYTQLSAMKTFRVEKKVKQNRFASNKNLACREESYTK
jgi:hypothetical protein